MSISIHLDNDRDGFAPGETITGELHWSGLPVSEMSFISLQLAFRTEGKGTSQREVFDEREWPLSASDGSESFEIQAPNWPWSFSGKLVSLLWTLDAWQEDDHAESIQVAISPNGSEIDLYHYDVAKIEKGRWEKMFSPTTKSSP